MQSLKDKSIYKLTLWIYKHCHSNLLLSLPPPSQHLSLSVLCGISPFLLLGEAEAEKYIARSREPIGPRKKRITEKS
jgi:hypothetical protein